MKIIGSFVATLAILSALCSPIRAQVIVKGGSYVSVGAGLNQYGLAIATATKLTVPNGAICAEITVETAPVRRTSDGTAPTTSVGTLFAVGAQFYDCGPLAVEQFTAVSGSPTLDIEYFK